VPGLYQGCEGAAGGAGLVAGLESAGAADLLPPSFGFGEAGNVGMVCLRLGASGRTSGPFCPQAASAPARYTIKHVIAKHFM
jgi:hypothetical protein